jgi:hypothetical protein
MEMKMTETVPVTRVDWTDAHGTSHSQVAGRDLLDAKIYSARQARTGNRYPGQRNYHGLVWFANTGAQLWHESLTERSALLWLDFTHDIVAIATQPMQMSFPDGTHHFPDFLALHSDMRQVVYNVKPEGLINLKVQAQFDNTTKLCKAVGWTHRVIPTFEPAYIRNIEYLANHRQPHSTPSDALTTQLIEGLSVPLSLGAAAALLSRAPRNTARTAIYNLAWYGEVQLDLSTPLSDQTLVRKAPHHVHN